MSSFDFFFKELFGMAENAQPAADFGGQHYHTVSQGEVAFDGEAFQFKRLNLFQWLSMDLNRWARLTIEQQREIVSCAGVIRHVLFVRPASNKFETSREQNSCCCLFMSVCGMVVLFGTMQI